MLETNVFKAWNEYKRRFLKHYEACAKREIRMKDWRQQMYEDGWIQLICDTMKPSPEILMSQIRNKYGVEIDHDDTVITVIETVYEGERCIGDLTTDNGKDVEFYYYDR